LEPQGHISIGFNFPLTPAVIHIEYKGRESAQ